MYFVAVILSDFVYLLSLALYVLEYIGIFIMCSYVVTLYPFVVCFDSFSVPLISNDRRWSTDDFLLSNAQLYGE